MNWILWAFALVGLAVIVGFMARTGRKSVVAVMVQNAFERTSLPGSDINPAKVANILVTSFWDAAPQLVTGGIFPKPSNFGLAVGAVMDGLDKTRPGSDAENATFLALGNLLTSSSAVNAAISNATDARLIDAANTLYISKADERLR
jgi:hypothetical protein